MPNRLHSQEQFAAYMGYRCSTSGFYVVDDTTWKRMSGYDGDDNRTDSDKKQAGMGGLYSLYCTPEGKRYNTRYQSTARRIWDVYYRQPAKLLAH